MKSLAVLSAALLVVFCAGYIAQAAMAGSESSDCSSQSCDDQIACRAAAPTQAVPTSQAPPAVTLPVVDPITPQDSAGAVVAPSWLDAVADGSVLPLASRSPPVA